MKQFLLSSQQTFLDSSNLEKDLHQLENLNGINESNYTVTITDGKAAITFTCHETLTMLPIVNFGNIKGNEWFRVGLSEYNLFGREIQTLGYYQYNTRHSFIFKSRVPYLKGVKWGMLTNFTLWKDIEPIYFEDEEVLYDYDNLALEAGGIYHVNLRHKLDFTVSYFQELYRKKEGEREDLGPGELEKEKLVLKTIYHYNKLNYHRQYVSGWAHDLNMQSLLSLNDNTPYFIAFNESRYFKQFKRSNIGFRLKLGLSTNEDDPFAPFILDSYVNIRGVGNKIDRGTGVAVLNGEWRQTLTEIGAIAIQGVVFTDVGSWRKPGGGFDDFINKENVKVFSGGGLRFIYRQAYGAVLRIDYGINLMDVSQGGLVLGVGQYF